MSKAEKEALRYDVEYQMRRKQQLRLHRGKAIKEIIQQITWMIEDGTIHTEPYKMVPVEDVFKACKDKVQRYMRRITEVPDWTMQPAYFKEALSSPKLPVTLVVVGDCLCVWGDDRPQPDYTLFPEKRQRTRKKAKKRGK